MQKILNQDLGSNPEEAQKLVKYTWEKDEIAYFFCPNYRAVFKVKFTGYRWFFLERWSEYSRKIYQFKYLECSKQKQNKIIHRMGVDNNGIAHREENVFYSTKEEAINVGMNYVEKTAMDAIKLFEKDMQTLKDYENKI